MHSTRDRRPPPARVLLIGMMGAGKSSVGTALAEAAGWSYVDNDDLVKQVTGSITRRVLEGGGEGALREAESAALAAALRLPPRTVAGVAAGVVTREVDRLLLGRATAAGDAVVWLRARLETLAERVRGSDRPWIGDDPAGALRRLAAGRAHLYAAVATHVVDVEEGTPRVLARQIMDLLGIPEAEPGGPVAPGRHCYG